MDVLQIQTRLKALGFDPGPIDGLMGRLTLAAIWEALGRLPIGTGVVVPAITSVVPANWMPDAAMDRIICHWTAGAHKASAVDQAHYHILIEGDGALVRGDHSIDDNVSAADGDYAAHTRGCNTGSIGVSLCCMAGAIESPFRAGQFPMTAVQWEVLSTVVAELCERYDIPVTARTVLSHAEVQGTLDIPQAGKWDFTRLAFDHSIIGAKACGDKLRREVSAKL